jgi:hypothetical protein
LPRARIDVAALPVLDQYVRGPLATIADLRRELAALKAAGLPGPCNHRARCAN